jgi:hypothetical protein
VCQSRNYTKRALGKDGKGLLMKPQGLQTEPRALRALPNNSRCDRGPGRRERALLDQLHRDRIGKLVADILRKAVAFESKNGALRSRVPIALVESEVARRLVAHVEIVAAIMNPDTTLPDVLIIPRDCRNDVQSLTACIDAQRTGRECSKISDHNRKLTRERSSKLHCRVCSDSTTSRAKTVSTGF